MSGLESILVEQGRKKQWLAQATGISMRTLTRYLKGQTEPPMAWLEASAHVLGCDVEDLLPIADDGTDERALVSATAAPRAGKRPEVVDEAVTE